MWWLILCVSLVSLWSLVWSNIPDIAVKVYFRIINTYNHLTVKLSRQPFIMWVGFIHSVESLMSKGWGLPREKEFCLKMIEILPKFPAYLPTLWISDLRLQTLAWVSSMSYRFRICWLSPTRRRQWHPTPVLLPGESHGWRSLVGCSPWGREESGTTERLHFHFSLSCIGEGNGNSLQCSCLENPRDRGAWWEAIYGVAQSWTRLKWLSSSSSPNSDV